MFDALITTIQNDALISEKAPGVARSVRASSILVRRLIDLWY
jgi:hypothetical protein